MADFDLDTAVKNLFDSIRHQARRTHTSVVLCTTAVLDNQLELALTKAMQPLSTTLHERLFESSTGPLHTFASKILMARALGVVTNEIFIELEKIRRIRNAFAHSAILLTFDSEAIAPQLSALKKRTPLKANAPEQFVDCAVVINQSLGAYLLGGERREEGKDTT